MPGKHRAFFVYIQFVIPSVTRNLLLQDKSQRRRFFAVALNDKRLLLYLIYGKIRTPI
jgi:hypothetical protein